MKRCPKCSAIKPLEEFHKNSRSKDGRAGYCSKCAIEYNKQRHKATYNHKLPKKVKNEKIHCRKCEKYLDKSKFYRNLSYCRDCSKLVGHAANLKRFGLTVEDYIDLEKSQNGLCKICNQPETHKRRLSVDHDHSCCPGANSCGKCIRGLLCFRCNAVLGQLGDNTDILDSMIEYLKVN
jgi:hypothetical protein